MEEKEVIARIVKIVTPFARNTDALENANRDTDFLADLQVNSSRLVDITLALEDEFDIEIDDDEADTVDTIGAAIDLIKKKK